MVRSSVTRLLSILIAVMVVLLVIGCAGLVLHAVTGYRDAGRVVGQAQADRALFNAVVAIRAQIGANLTALLAEDDPVPTFERTRKNADSALATALNALAATDLARRDTLVAAIRQANAAGPEATALLVKEAAKPRSERDTRVVAPWRDAVFHLLDQVTAASAAISNSVRMKDSLIAETTRVRQTSWGIRDNFGNQCTFLRPYVNRDEKLPDAVVRSYATGLGGARAGWDQLSELSARPGFSASLADAIQTARKSVEQAQAQIDKIVAGLGDPAETKVDSRQWTSLCNAPFEPIIAIAFKALDLAIQHAEEQKDIALREAVLATLALIVAAALGIFAIVQVQVRLARPAQGIVAAIAYLSERDFTRPVPPAPFPDELGAMTSALEQLRINSAQAELLQEAAAQAREVELARAKRVDAKCREFDETVRGVLACISQSAGTLRSTAGTMNNLAEEEGVCAATVAASADEALINVNTVAAATEELTASVGEIAQRAAGSAANARQAALQTEETTRAMDAMNDSAQRVGKVLALINGIASQTNLLALNATIEAARAGEAGKGFAVVAGEVKALANQTAKATEDIGVQIADIQATTARAVAAIQGITALIHGIDQTSTAIAVAVEEQGAATQEISRNVQQAAEGTAQVTTAIAQVAQSSKETGAAADAVLRSVDMLADEQRALAEAIEEFIRQVRA